MSESFHGHGGNKTRVVKKFLLTNPGWHTYDEIKEATWIENNQSLSTVLYHLTHDLEWADLKCEGMDYSSPFQGFRIRNEVRRYEIKVEVAGFRYDFDFFTDRGPEKLVAAIEQFIESGVSSVGVTTVPGEVYDRILASTSEEESNEG